MERKEHRGGKTTLKCRSGCTLRIGGKGRGGEEEMEEEAGEGGK